MTPMVFPVNPAEKTYPYSRTSRSLKATRKGGGGESEKNVLEAGEMAPGLSADGPCRGIDSGSQHPH